jgi:hypothetical protein
VGGIHASDVRVAGDNVAAAQGKAYSNIRRKLVALTEQLKERKERGETLCII